MAVLFTGATGFFGSHVLHHLLAERPAETVTVLGRGGEDALRTRVEGALGWLAGGPLDATARGRLRYAAVDLAAPDLGLTPRRRAALVDGCTAVWHCAGRLALQGDPAPLFAVNVAGTRRVLELAAEAPGARVLHVSTAYVAGRRRDGEVRETDLTEEHGFQTYYEETKYTAERLVHAWSARTGRRATILRPSLLVTDRPAPEGLPQQPLTVLLRLIDGALAERAADDEALAGLLNGVDVRGSGLRLRLRADPEGQVNLVQVEYAARAAVRTAEARTTDRVRTVHLTHPRNTGFDVARRAFEERYLGIGLTAVPEVPAPDPFERLFTRYLGDLLAFSGHRRAYDRTHLLQDAPGLPEPAPVDSRYLARALGCAAPAGAG